MTDNEKILKGLSLMAAELHIQNYNFIAAQNGLKPGFTNVSETLIPKLADHFEAYFGGGSFSPGSVMVFNVKKGR